MKRFGKYVLNTFLGIICALPVITLCTSITAMHFVNFKLQKDDSVNVFKEFFKSFRQNFVQSIVFLIIIGGVGTLVGWSWVSLFTAEGDFSYIIGGLLLVATLIFFNFECVSTYLLAKFENTTKRLILITIYASVRHMDVVTKASFMEAAMIAVPALIICVNPNIVTFSIGVVIFLALCVAFQIISSKLIIPIFDELIKQNEEASQQ